MNVKQMKSILTTNKFDNIECNFKLKTGNPKVTLEYLAEQLEKINYRLARVEERLDRIEARIDNLVTKNNLKE